jgi:hypothetical protein
MDWALPFNISSSENGIMGFTSEYDDGSDATWLLSDEQGLIQSHGGSDQQPDQPSHSGRQEPIQPQNTVDQQSVPPSLLAEQEPVHPQGSIDHEPASGHRHVDQDPDYIRVRNLIFGAHIKVRFGERLRQALALTCLRVDLLGDVGIIEVPGGGILICSAVFGTFLQLKPNSVNRNMRQHGFVHGSKIDPRAAFRAIGVTDHKCYAWKWFHWTNSVLERFNHLATPDDVERLAAYASGVRNGEQILPVQNDPRAAIFVHLE